MDTQKYAYYRFDNMIYSDQKLHFKVVGVADSNY